MAFKLVEMKSRIDAARLLVCGRRMARNNQNFDLAAGSMAKLAASETAVYVTDEAIRYWANEYTRDYPVERMHRDAKIFTDLRGNQRNPAPGDSRALTGLQIR